jgi:FtsP/CotA-like multicopper oxidase with cupredoxin domain
MTIARGNNSSARERRSLLKLGLKAAGVTAAGAALLRPRWLGAQNKVSGQGTTSPVQVAGTATPGRMFLQPFLQSLPIPPLKLPTTLVPAPAEFPVVGEAGRLPFQAFRQFPPQVTYEVRVRPARHQFHPHLPVDDVWGYDGMVPGPTFVGQIGVAAVVRFYNDLPQNHVGFGSPEISTHLHSGHTPAESDGFAGDYYSAFKAGPTLPGGPGRFLDYHYPAVPANNDLRNVTGTFWYHDHREDFTAANVYRGLAGFTLAFDAIDSGNENDPSPTALRLPAGVGRYDIPLMLQDKKFDASGHLVFDQFDPEGAVGDQFLVNGVVQPYFNVEARKYRFRMCNGNTTRFFEMYLADERDRDLPFSFIASDGNLLPAPVTLKKIFMGMAERADIVVDFSTFAGEKLYLVNRLFQDNPRKPDDDRMYPGIRMLQFRVGGLPAIPDNSRVPARLRDLEPINLAAVAKTRRFEFERRNGQWAINDKFFDPERVDAAPRRGVPEIWIFENGGGGWAHPIHVHLDDFRVLSINGKTPPPEWRGRKDVVVLMPGDEVRIYVRFTNYVGKYMMHCHNTVHEDHAMMIRYDVVP